MATSALITGAGGLIGGHVLEYWDIDDLEAIPLHRADGDLLEAGVPTALLRRLRPTVVVHLAWTASGTPGYRSSESQSRWVDATLELDRACRELGASLIATGTALDQGAVDGDDYSIAKSRLRAALAPAIAARELAWLRPFYVFDPVRRRPALVADAMQAREEQRALLIRTPNSRHDFVHASDVASAVIEVVRHQLRGVVPIGSGRARSVHELVEALGVEWAPLSGPDVVGPQYHEPADTTRLRALGWSPHQTERLFIGG